RPGGHAVHVRGVLRAREFLELLPARPDRLLDGAKDAEVPGLRVEAGDRPVVQHWPLFGKRLPRRDPLRNLRRQILRLTEQHHGAFSGPWSICAAMKPWIRA